MEPNYEELDDDGRLELPAEPMRLNMGPSHPAMHGTIRMVLELDGETVVDVDVPVSYTHLDVYKRQSSCSLARPRAATSRSRGGWWMGSGDPSPTSPAITRCR